MEITKTKVIKF